MTEDELEGLDDREAQLVMLASRRAVSQLRSKDRWSRSAVFVLAGAVAAAAIAIPTTYVITHENDKITARHERAAIAKNSRKNCQLITAVARAQATRQIENHRSTEQFKRESLDRFGLSPRRFNELMKKGQRAEARQLATYEAVAHTNCQIE